MSNISLEAILELKRQSGASLSACKTALQSSNGDLPKALALLRASTENEMQLIKQATGLSTDECFDLLNEWGSSSKALAHLSEERKKKEEPESTHKAASTIPSKTFTEIWEISDPLKFVHELRQYLTDKKIFRKLELNSTENTFYLLAEMQAVIEAEGFVDLFDQEYSLKDCALVENGLRELGLHKLAGLFSEAKSIYTRHNPEITQNMYENLNPFQLPKKEGKRFDQIADEFYKNGSQLFQIPSKLAIYARNKQSDFSP